MGLEVDFKIDTSRVDAALNKLGAGVGGVLPAPLKIAFTRAGVVYMAWARTRFVRASRGDGTWLPLSWLTKLARLRKNKRVWGKFLKTKKTLADKGKASAHRDTVAAMELGGSSFEILRDTGTLLNSISSGGPGSVAELTDRGIRLGTRVVIAKYHQHPTVPGHPPQRVVIPLPDPTTLANMRDEVQVGIDGVIKEAGLQ